MAREWRGGDACKRIISTSLTWANSAAANTERYVDLGSPDDLERQPNSGLLVVVRNPSAVTDLAGEVRFEDDDNGTLRYPTFTTFTASRANSDGQVFLVDAGLLLRGRVVLENATILGGADGFSAHVAVYAF